MATSAAITELEVSAADVTGAAGSTATVVISGSVATRLAFLELGVVWPLDSGRLIAAGLGSSVPIGWELTVTPHPTFATACLLELRHWRLEELPLLPASTLVTLYLRLGELTGPHTLTLYVRQDATNYTERLLEEWGYGGHGSDPVLVSTSGCTITVT